MEKLNFKKKAIVLIFCIITIFSLCLFGLNSNADSYNVYSGTKEDAADEINAFIQSCYSSGKDAYFEEGTYTLDGNIILKNGVSLLGDDNKTIFKASSQVYIYTTVGNVSNVTIDGFIFDNVTVFVRDLNCEGFVISNNIFLNAKYANQEVDSGMRSNTGYYLLIKHNAAEIKSNIFLRDKNSLGRGVGLYKTHDCVISDNYFGMLEDLPNSIVSDTVKSKYNTIINYPNLNKNSNQGYFMTAINVLSQDENVTITGNHISLNDDISEATNANNELYYQRDHLIYAKEYNGLDIVGNYFKGSNKNADGGVKVRNGQNSIIYKNVLEDAPLLLYIQDASSCSFLKNMYVDSNVFINTYHNALTASAGISNIKTKNISDNYLMYLRSYHTSYQWENITITNNRSISYNLGNERMYMYRNANGSQCDMPTNFTFTNNVDLIGTKFDIIGHDSLNQNKKEDFSNGTMYVPTIESKYVSLDITNYWKKEVSLETGNQTIIIPEGKEVYLYDDTLIKYTGEKLNPGNYKVVVATIGSKTILVEGVQSTAFETISYSFSDVTITNHVHNFDTKFTIDVSPTCTEEGSQSRHCLTPGCDGKTDVQVINPSHSLVEYQEKSPTCTTDGNVPYRHCTVCGKDFDLNGGILENVIIPASHGLMHEIGKEATCESDGILEHNVCIICNKKFDLNGKELNDVVIPGGHSLMYVAAKSGTCAIKGNIEHKHCTECGKNFDMNNNLVLNVEIVKDHTFTIIPSINATCTQTGNIEYKYCTVCGSSFDMSGNQLAYEDTIIQPSHNYVFVNGVESTCSTEGIVPHKQCTVCKKTFDYAHNPLTNITSPKKDHNYNDSWEYDDNSHWHKCDCGELSTKEQHKYKDSIIKQPTKSEEGIKERVCECGHKYTETIPKEPSFSIGCMGSVGASLFGVIILTCVVVLLNKKKKED